MSVLQLQIKVGKMTYSIHSLGTSGLPYEKDIIRFLHTSSHTKNDKWVLEINQRSKTSKVLEYFVDGLHDFKLENDFLNNNNIQKKKKKKKNSFRIK